MSRRRRAERTRRQRLNSEMRLLRMAQSTEQEKKKKTRKLAPPTKPINRATPTKPINRAAFHGPEQTKKKFYKA